MLACAGIPCLHVLTSNALLHHVSTVVSEGIIEMETLERDAI
jgi:hypothetical protein